MKSLKAATYVEEKLDDLPAGLERTVGRIMENHFGEGNAFDREKMVAWIASLPGFETVDDRLVRRAIEQLRDQGMLICNTGDGAGYYLASTLAEYRKFRKNYGGRAFTILARIKAMDDQATILWGQSFDQPVQPNLF